ncbi:tRNA (adenosine(37)-N6)-threonylcarbamoyltransferase complex dimerization subunit type 1 TsaB [Beggiatoa leptomitoformis]|uniref:tRNA threonylcarbamoyladenosine biosynthesis protein TsaB n=1 Tax=Beggiatoa leptomitoformis TaxID=288004 RepID=A0A2N9YEM6_9GAMM|nr:tRNA (adenosine(37)-N6)-threonylcarbamoyltransferase complex dimerization subunit type 1 TsaB [Beggiatoa leptomitoformis]ALG68703.1 tRNA (adenosine(37)-N6)-threonylcarbamoyltransferase complex dimerization subunit type 1 TsaB [Beggiatoa leptomitoformis]AUI68943.1 tRNA (adenosine(37)-N6)-threonylcarbamoyltransferase complex dimerization subunit type 1 TsaB [Beggiatoa leptomitoformis]
MNILLLDTATEACSCALSVQGNLTQRFTLDPRKHAELILPMADDLLQTAGLTPSDLDAVAFGCGPGSFTGLRIACGVAQGIAFAATIPVIPVSNLAILAQMAYAEWGEKQVLTAIDARLQEVYWGIYQLDAAGVMVLQGEECVCPAQQVPVPISNGWFGMGSGWQAYADVLSQRLAGALTRYKGDVYPTAGAMLPLALQALAQGKTVSAAEAMPVYLRNKVV